MPKLAQPKVARGGGDGSATCSGGCGDDKCAGSDIRHDLGRAQEVSEGLCSDPQIECDDANLAKEILSGPEAKPDSARYHLRSLPPEATFALLAGNSYFA